MIRAGDRHRIIGISGSKGVYEVDFRSYFFQWPHTVFLRPGQYLDVLSGDLRTRETPLPKPPEDARVLFTHVYEVGSVDAPLPTGDPGETLEAATCEWHAQRPFHPRQSRDHAELLLDLTELIEASLPDHASPADIATRMAMSHQALNRLTTSHTGSSVGQLMTGKRLTESRRQLAFSDAPIKEISDAVGFGDAAYFSRRFTKATGESPTEFRRRISERAGDPFTERLFHEMERHHGDPEATAKIAAAFGLDPRSLDAKTMRHTGHRLHKLLARRKAAQAAHILRDGASVTEAAEALDFADPFAFSKFFKREAGLPPSQLKESKVQKVQEVVTI